MRFVVFSLCALCVSAQSRGLQDEEAKHGGTGGRKYKLTNSMMKDTRKSRAGMGASRDVPIAPTLPPVAPVTPAPVPDPVPMTPPIPPVPIDESTAALVQASFIPGGMMDTLATTTSESFLGELFEFTGELQVVDGGIVSLARLSDIVDQITCDQPNKAIQVDFNVEIGESQIGNLFPEGATLVVNSAFFGSCLLGKESHPPGVVNGFHNSTQVYPEPGVGAGDAFLVISQVTVANGYTVIIHGQTGTFFNMFSEGNLSIKRLADPGRFLMEDEAEEWDGEEDLKDYAGRRKLFIEDYFTFLNTDNVFVDTFTSLVEDGGLDDLQATWDASGLVMNVEVNLEFLTTYDLLAGVFPGEIEAGRIEEQDFPVFKSSLVPNVLALFKDLNSYSLPGIVMDFFSESPLFLEFDEGSISTQLGYLSRLRYSTGRKKYNFSASGSWDALAVTSVVTETSPGRFSASNFREDFVADYVPDPDAPLTNSFNIFAGVTAQLEIYGSLFSGNYGVDMGIQLTSVNAPDGGNFPPLISDDIEVVFDGDCELCPASIVKVAARAGELVLELNLGFYLDTDLVGPSSANTPANLQFSYVDPATNPSAFVERAVFCLDPQYGGGADETLSCGDICCDGTTGGTCGLDLNETMGICSSP